MVIIAHFHTYRALCQWVKESAAAHVSSKTASSQRFDPNRSTIWLLHTAGKVNGRAGTCLPNRFNELHKRSMHSFTSRDCLAAKYSESTRAWHSRFWEILLEKKNQGLRESHWLWNKSSCVKCHGEVVHCRCLWESSQVVLVVPWGTPVRSYV